MSKSPLHIIVGLVLAFLLLTLAGFVPFWMPMMGEMTAVLIVTVLLLVWIGFVLKEQAHDEREALLTMKSGRVAYLSGLFVLMVALIMQGKEAMIDPWIALALAVMVVAKLASRFFNE